MLVYAPARAHTELRSVTMNTGRQTGLFMRAGALAALLLLGACDREPEVYTVEQAKPALEESATFDRLQVKNPTLACFCGE